MAGNFGGRGKPQKKLIGRGVLDAVRTEGPHTEWLGMPPYYMHYLMISPEDKPQEGEGAEGGGEAVDDDEMKEMLDEAIGDGGDYQDARKKH